MSRVNLRSRNQNAPNYAVTTMEETHRDFPNAELFGMMSGEYLDPQARWFIKNLDRREAAVRAVDDAVLPALGPEFAIS